MYTVVDDKDILLFIKGPDQVIWLEKLDEKNYRAEAIHFDKAENHFRCINRSDLADIVKDSIKESKDSTCLN